jgi:hypothetical protein
VLLGLATTTPGLKITSIYDQIVRYITHRSTRGLGTQISNICKDSCFSDGRLSFNILVNDGLSEDGRTKCQRREDERTHDRQSLKNSKTKEGEGLGELLSGAKT